LTAGEALDERVYYWRVKALDGAANGSSWASAWSLTMDTTCPTISDVTASGVTTSTAIISWTTNEPSTSLVEYGTTSAYGSTPVSDGTLTTSHSVTLTDLAAGTAYHVRVTSVDGAGNAATYGDYTFATSSPLPIGPIVGATVGGIMVIGLVIYFLIRRRAAKRKAA
jgi:hypothetical protein